MAPSALEPASHAPFIGSIFLDNIQKYERFDLTLVFRDISGPFKKPFALARNLL